MKKMAVVAVVLILLLPLASGCSSLSPEDAYSMLVGHSLEISRLDSISGLLGWDFETMMPPEGSEARGEALAALEEVIQQKSTIPEIGEWLRAANKKEDWAVVEAANLREWRKDYDRNRKIPEELVAREAKLATEGYQAWIEAREANDFQIFAPVLGELVEIHRERADCIGWEKERYDALLDLYEPQMTAEEYQELFGQLKEPLVELVSTAVERQGAPPVPMEGNFSLEAQEAFSREVSQVLGFDFERGRMDSSVHPFTAIVWNTDVRFTTTYDEPDVLVPVLSTLHEIGHGIYEQNLLCDGTPAGMYASSGIHESQSRLRENQIGRSEPFWQYFLPRFNQVFSTDLTLEEIMDRVTRVEPGPTRTLADPVSYDLHIIIRFEIERDLINGNLEVAEVPAVWNEKYREYLGVEVQDDLQGVLQDIHWSCGSFGYFPTYTLGNIFAAQLFAAAGRNIDDLPGKITAGDFSALNDWLSENIYQHGRVYPPQELIELASGEPVSSAYLLDSLKENYVNR